MDDNVPGAYLNRLFSCYLFSRDTLLIHCKHRFYLGAGLFNQCQGLFLRVSDDLLRLGFSFLNPLLFDFIDDLIEVDNSIFLFVHGFVE